MISIVENGNIYEFRGLSTDTKPTELIDSAGKNQPIGNGSTYFEMDTSKLYMFNGDASSWVEVFWPKQRV